MASLRATTVSFRSIISRFGSNRVVLYSSAATIAGAGFYGYHSTQSSSEVIASQNPRNEVQSYTQNELFHDYASSANTNNRFQRITIPGGKATVINYDAINEQNYLRHVIITVQGEGEIHYSPADEKILHGIDRQVVEKKLKLGSSVGIPSTNWHQIVNKHDSNDLVLVVTSIPTEQTKQTKKKEMVPTEYVL